MRAKAWSSWEAIMRADALLRTLNADEKAALFERWGLRHDDGDDALLRRMRAPEAWGPVAASMDSVDALQELAGVCARPGELLAHDDLRAAASLEAIGLIAASPDGRWAVNEDLALALVSSFPVEHGYAATLAARMADDDLRVFARALEVSPQTNRIDWVLAIAHAWVDRTRIRRKIATLSDDERAGLRQALDAGVLPDVGPWTLETTLPTVHADRARPTQGLLTNYAHEAAEVAPRGLLPLEALQTVAEALESLPAIEATARRTRTRAPARATRTRPADPSPPTAPVNVSEPDVRTVQVVSASAIVDLGGEAQARTLRENWELWSEVALSIDRRRVALKPNVDVATWTQRAALALADKTANG